MKIMVANLGIKHVSETMLEVIDFVLYLVTVW